jgi:hypothetical protein
MTLKMRIEVEKRIVSAVVKQALAAGYRLTPSTDRGYDVEPDSPLLGCLGVPTAQIVAELTAADEAHLFIHGPTGPMMTDDGGLITVGWVNFVFGNDGWDVISDYTTNLDKLGILTNAERISKRYES